MTRRRKIFKRSSRRNYKSKVRRKNNRSTHKKRHSRKRQRYSRKRRRRRGGVNLHGFLPQMSRKEDVNNRLALAKGKKCNIGSNRTSKKVEIANMDVLKETLTRYNVPWEFWRELQQMGIRDYKTIEDLFEEIQQDESKLVIINETDLVRRVTAAEVNITIQGQKGMYKLVESHHHFYNEQDEELVDLRRTKRGNVGLREKIKGEEGSKNISGEGYIPAMRGIREELGESIAEIVFQGNWKGQIINTEVKNSHSYPGLCAEYLYYSFDVSIPMGKYDALKEMISEPILDTGYNKNGRTRKIQWKLIPI